MRNLKALLMMVFMLLLFISEAAYTRMYQWTEPETGSTQLSGKPPVWYRGESGGPRVFVFDNGRLIDDTAVEVTDEIRHNMRQQAFVLAEEDKQKAKDKIAKSNELKQKFVEEGTTEQIEDEVEVTEREAITNKKPLPTEPIYEDVVENEESSDGKSLEELRKLISDWEKNQSENIRKILE